MSWSFDLKIKIKEGIRFGDGSIKLDTEAEEKAFKEAGNKVYMIMGARTKDLIFWQDKMKDAIVPHRNNRREHNWKYHS